MVTSNRKIGLLRPVVLARSVPVWDLSLGVAFGDEIVQRAELLAGDQAAPASATRSSGAVEAQLLERMTPTFTSTLFFRRS